MYVFVAHCLVVSILLHLGVVFATTTTDCRQALDVVFHVDCNSDCESSTNLVNEISSQLDPSMFGTHVGVFSFAANASTIAALSHQPPLNRTTPTRHGHRLDAAIRHTRSVVFTNEDGDRPEAPDVLVIITHRASDDTASSVAAAEQLKNDGVKIITVGIAVHGVDALKHELRVIASYPREADRLISIHDYYQPSLLSALMEAVCRREFDADVGTLRLSDEQAASGRLQVFVDGQWVAVCGQT